MIARAWGAAKACGRFADWLFGWLFALTLCLWGAAWCVGSLHAGRFLGLDEVVALINHWAALVGLN
jgi:hypothetical protein